VARERWVEINWDLQDGKPHLGERIVLNFFDDVQYSAQLERIEGLSGGGYSWIGRLEGIEMSSVTLVVQQGFVVGKVASSEGAYRIRSVGGALHAVQELDPSQFPKELEPRPVIAAKTFAPQAATAADDGSVLDLLVAYTDDVRTAAGSAAVIEAEIRMALAEANTAYANSGINFRLALVFAGEINYAETGDSGADLDALEAGTPPFDTVHAWRNTYHADNVSLVTLNGGCGLANLMIYAMDSSFHSQAFHTISYACLTGNMTLPHEHGHNMGARHDWFVDDTVGWPYSYAHGYANPADGWRTVMAYNDWCDCTDESSPCPATRSTNGPYCTRLPYFSNPEVTINGDPTGMPEGSSTSCNSFLYSPDPANCEADNRRTLNNHAPVTAGFRASQITWTGNSSSDWNTPGNWVMAEGPPGATYPVQRAPRTIDDVFIPAAPAGGRFPTLSSGTHSARDVLIEAGGQLTMNGGELNVYGDWEEQGAGGFNGTGGTVVFSSVLEGDITTGGSSRFHHLEIGDGLSSGQANLKSDLQVDGDLVIRSGARLAAEDRTIRINGHWTDENGGFLPGTSTVIFDGALQNMELTDNSLELIDEDFSQWDGDCCFPTQPAGWYNESPSGYGWVMGELSDADNSAAMLWDDSTDAWLFSHAVTLRPGVIYEITYKYRARNADPGPINFSVWLASAQNSSSVISGVSSVSTSSTTFQTQTDSFTVDSTGTYYLGFRAQRPAGLQYAPLDDIILTGTVPLAFYDAQVNSLIYTTSSDDIQVLNDLRVSTDGSLLLQGAQLSVEGELTNSGILSEVLDAPAGSTTRFLHIQNIAGDSDKYYGIDLTPNASSLGSTKVSVKGNNGYCDGGGKTIQRCFLITPTNQQPARVRFWFLDGEKSTLNPTQVAAFHWSGLGWEALSMAGTSNGSLGGYHWAEAVNVSSYSPFALALPWDPPISAPTSVTLADFSAQAYLGKLRIEWQTLLEIDILGYNLYRATSLLGTRTKINSALIPSNPDGILMGGSYDFVDADLEGGTHYFYWLEAVGQYNTTFDPTEATAPYVVYVPIILR
jgi:hypothetical protein